MPIKLLCLVLLFILTQGGIFQDRYDEAYRIAVAMTLDQKIGQTLQVDFGAFNTKKGTDEQEAIKLHLGSLLVGGDGMPDANGNMVDIPDKEDQDRALYATATI